MTGTLGTIVDAYPLTAMQAGMIFHNSYAPDTATYHDLLTITLRGRYDADALRASLDEVVAAHPVLRTSFEIADLSEPLQLVHAAVVVPFLETDLSTDGPDVARTRLRAWGEEEKRRPFDLGTPPLLRVFAHRLSDTDVAVALSFHHAILDGWSTAALMTELLRRYSAHLAGTPLAVAPPPLRFRDAVAAERATVASAATVAYWRSLLADAEPMRLPRRPGYPSGDSENVDNVGGTIDPTVFAALEKLARDLRVPLRTVLLAGHLRVMGLVGGTHDAMTGVVTHSRPEHSRGSEVLGMFLNAVPVRVGLDTPSWSALARRVFDAELAMLAHRLFPLAEIHRVTGRSNLFETVFDYRDFHVYRGLSDVRGLEIVDYDYFDQTNLPLAVGVVRAGEDGLPRVHLVYARDQFPRTQMTALRDAYLRVYAEMAADPGADPRRTGVLLGPDAARIASWQGRAATYPGRLTSAASDGDAPAVVTGDGVVLSHAGFAARASGLAGRLVELGVGVGTPVGISLPRGVDLLVAVQAVLRAGGAFVSLDPELPDGRLRWMASKAGVEVVITDGPWDGTTTVHPGESAEADLPAALPADALAYVMFTSGSSGRPKGVGVSRGALANRLWWAQETFGLTSADRVLVKTPFSFDVSVWELVWPLMVGASVVVARPGGHRDPAYLAGLGVSTVHFVPSMLEAFLDSGVRPSGWRRVLCSGEALSPSLVDRFFSAFPGVELFNLYGPTEAAIDVSWHRCVPGSSVVPIGRPVANTRLEVRDPVGERVPVGAPGELWIGGVQVASGYVGEPGLTAERFVDGWYRTGDRARWLPTGEIEYLGRLDGQVKIRGQRIEPAEIETVLREHPAVREAVVVARPSPGGDPQLVAYVVPESDALDRVGAGTLEAERVTQWSGVFDDAYRAPADDATFHLGGWTSSYTGDPIPPAEMARWLDDTVARIRSTGPRRVLEIGCGTGLVLFRLAPHVEAYLGLDIAEAGLAHIREQLTCEPLPHVTVARGSLPELAALPPSTVDTVVLNSVAQYFPDAGYLVRVLEAAVAATAPGGRIFLGDVRHRSLLTALHASVELHRAADATGVDALRQAVARRVAGEQELALDPGFFAALTGRLPRLGRVEVALKRGRADNELIRFRYDVTLHLDTAPAEPLEGWVPWGGLDDVRARLGGAAGLGGTARLEGAARLSGAARLGVAGVPNARLARPARLLALLADPTGPPTAAALREATAPADGVDPEDLFALGEELGFAVDVSPSGGDPTRCDVVFRRPDTPPAAPWEAGPAAPPHAGPGGRPAGGGALDRFANRPLHGRLAAELAGPWRQHLAARLPEFMVPSVFLPLTELPVTVNGKLDRAALPAPDALRAEVPHEEPSTDAERAVARVWREVFGLARVSARDDFFAVGGNSIRSLMVVARLRQAGYRLEGQLLFTRPELRDLAAALEHTDTSPGAGPVAEPFDLLPARPDRADLVDGYPLTPIQAAMVAHTDARPDVAVYRDVFTLTLRGPFDRAALTAALAEVTVRHEALRTSFDREAQYVHRAAEVPLTVADLSTVDAAEVAGRLDRRRREERARALPWDTPPLLRAHVDTMPGGEFALTLTFHHAVLDGWSLASLTTEIVRRYAARLAGDPLPTDPPAVRYRDFVARTREVVEEPAERAFWADRVRGAVPTALPRTRRPAEGEPLGVVAEIVPDTVAAGLDRAARALRVPLSTVLLAAHVRALGGFCAVDEVQTGLVMHGRPEEEGGVEVLGMYLTPLPLRVATGTDRWPAFVRRVHGAELELLPHRHFPYVEIDRIAGGPQFDTVFEFRDFHVYREGGTPGPVQVVSRRIIEHTHFPLAANFVRTHPDRGLVLLLNHATDRHDEAQVSRLAAGYRQALAALAEEVAPR